MLMLCAGAVQIRPVVESQQWQGGACPQCFGGYDRRSLVRLARIGVLGRAVADLLALILARHLTHYPSCKLRAAGTSTATPRPTQSWTLSPSTRVTRPSSRSVLSALRPRETKVTDAACRHPQDVAWHCLQENIFASVGDDRQLIMYVCPPLSRCISSR